MEPITRQEMFLAAASGEEVTLPEPITREEMYLKAIVDNGGGGQGTSNYNALTNKPKINGVEVQGNKTSNDYGIIIPTKTSDLQNDSNFVADANYVHTDNNYDATSKGIVDGVTSALAGKADNTQIQALTNEVRGNWATGGVNRLPFTLVSLKALNTSGTWADNVYTLNNATFTVQLDTNGNVSGIKANGTPNASTSFKVGVPLSTGFLSGCPAGGSWSKYVLFQSGGATDTGSGASGANTSATVTIYIESGYAADNLMFYPMVRLTTDSDPTYQPYAKTNLELTQDVANLIKYTDISFTLSDYTLSGGDGGVYYLPFASCVPVANATRVLAATLTNDFTAFLDSYGIRPMIAGNERVGFLASVGTFTNTNSKITIRVMYI